MEIREEGERIAALGRREVPLDVFPMFLDTALNARAVTFPPLASIFGVVVKKSPNRCSGTSYYGYSEPPHFALLPFEKRARHVNRG